MRVEFQYCLAKAQSKGISIAKAMVSVLLYGYEIWPTTSSNRRSVDAVQTKPSRELTDWNGNTSFQTPESYRWPVSYCFFGNWLFRHSGGSFICSECQRKLLQNRTRNKESPSHRWKHPQMRSRFRWRKILGYFLERPPRWHPRTGLIPSIMEAESVVFFYVGHLGRLKKKNSA